MGFGDVYKRQILSYLHSGALVCPIDLSSGKLGKLINSNYYLNSYHPKNGEAIEGRVIPFWEEVKQKTIEIHSLIASLPLIGWDLAITPRGMLFLEGNTYPALNIHQKKPFTPFIPSEFYHLLLHHLVK